MRDLLDRIKLKY